MSDLQTRSRWPGDAAVAVAPGRSNMPQEATGAAGADLAQESGGALDAILAKLSADPATQTTLAAILAKIIAAPATETTVAAILAKIIASPATEAKQDAVVTAINALGTKLDTAITHLAAIELNTDRIP